MTFEVEINGRTPHVSVERDGPAGSASASTATAHDVDAARVGEYGLSLLLDGERGCAAAKCRSSPPAALASCSSASMDGRSRSASTAGAPRRGAADARCRADGEQPIVAPMPGRVVRSWSPRVTQWRRARR